MSKNPQTTTQDLPGKKPNWRCGAPAGNRNAAKPFNTLSRRIRALKTRARELARRVP